MRVSVCITGFLAVNSQAGLLYWATTFQGAVGANAHGEKSPV